jgi:hypothetical protein
MTPSDSAITILIHLAGGESRLAEAADARWHEERGNAPPPRTA